MTRRTSRLLAPGTPGLVDVYAAQDTIDDTMSLGVPEQLLTPDASRSETSSTSEIASTEDQPASRRRSTRVVRASMRATEALENTPLKKDQATTSTSQAYVDNLVKSKRSRSGLRHSIAVMESSLSDESPLPAIGTEMEDQPRAPDTPTSKSSQDAQVDDMQESVQNRLEKTSTKEDTLALTALQNASRQSLRRSNRVSILSKASYLLDRATSVLGKRTRDMSVKEERISRRASLRPRNIAPVKQAEPLPNPPKTAPEKRRVSESDLLKLKSKEVSPSEEPAPQSIPRPRPKPKMWLNHGLYSGQEGSDSPPKQRKSKNSGKTSSDVRQRLHLPMPIFAGARLVKNGRDYVLPFDIFSPLPSGQPKPDEWRKTNKNVFVGDAAGEWKANKKLELSTCMCERETGCDENCQNRYMFYECDSGNCSLGSECGNRNFSELKIRTKAGGKYNIGVEVIKTVDRGYGVRSNRSFEPNQIIVEYTGEIITQFECERRMRNVYKNNECYYLMYFDQNMIIDATRGSIARFVNHSCQPNCRMEKWTVAGKPRMALFAGDRGVMTGEELSYDYNFEWVHLGDAFQERKKLTDVFDSPYSNKNVQECRCGAANCRGILGPRPKDRDQRAKPEAADSTKKPLKSTGTKRKRTTTAGTASVQAKKRKLLTPKSVKAGIKKAATKVSIARSKTPTTKKSNTVATSTVNGQRGAKSTAKKNVKLPTVKAASRVKAAVQRKTGPTKTTSNVAKGSKSTKKEKALIAKPNTKGKSNNKEAGSGKPSTGSRPSKSSAKANTSAAKAKRSPVKTATKAQGLGNTVKKVVRRVVRPVKTTEK
ncbi:hypothetical protein N7478_001567 [Penicillium angulare]|uniref:uncharacterized protein n=1 Tax=Penicillium angulare TaxID=116970 RepID=UPI0025417335|nr:uncharacterized protein N7478_001567 [Penicillium angulare]KAJ5288537.1 hypothetical protein N7478_001567 [Penicillium angulare]